MKFTQYLNGFLLFSGCVIVFCNLQSSEDENENMVEFTNCLSLRNYSGDGATDALVKCLTKISDYRWNILCQKLQNVNYPPVCWISVLSDLPPECANSAAGAKHLKTIRRNVLISQLTHCIEKRHTQNYQRLLSLQLSNNYP